MENGGSQPSIPTTPSKRKRNEKNDSGLETVELHPSGDAFAILGSPARKKILVYSNFLKSSSAYLANRLKAGSKKDKPTIDLKGDDEEAAELILSILHFRFTDDFSTVDISKLARITILAKKYDCVMALTWWGVKACRELLYKIQGARGLGALLAVTHVFAAREEFELVAGHIVADVSVGKLSELRHYQLAKDLLSEGIISE